MSVKSILLPLVFIILLSSCHALVEDEFPNFAKVPVMNSLLQADSTFRVQVSLTANLNDTAPTPVKNAKVIIESSDDNLDTLLYTEKGWYISPRKVKVGVSYTCRAIIPNFPILSAQTTIPVPTVIDSISFNDIVGRDKEGSKISSVEFRIINDFNVKKFWLVKLKVKGFGRDYNLDTQKWIEGLIVKDKYFYMQAGQDLVLLNEANPLELFSNKKMKDEFYWVKTYFNERSGSYISNNDTLFVELMNVDESYYQYKKQYYIYESSSYPSIGQSAQKYPLYSNIKNGLGLFTGISVTRKELVPILPKGK